MVSLLGGAPVTIAYAEVYLALMQGIVDVWQTALPPAYRDKWFEPSGCKYFTFANHLLALNFLGVNKDAFANLPKDLQDLVVEFFTKRQEFDHNRLRDEVATFTLKAIMDYGVNIKAMHPALREEIRKACRPLYEDWAKAYGPEGTALLSRVGKFHEEYIKR